jgi:hypothetical protein
VKNDNFLTYVVAFLRRNNTHTTAQDADYAGQENMNLKEREVKLEVKLEKIHDEVHIQEEAIKQLLLIKIHHTTL